MNHSTPNSRQLKNDWTTPTKDFLLVVAVKRRRLTPRWCKKPPIWSGLEGRKLHGAAVAIERYARGVHDGLPIASASRLPIGQAAAVAYVASEQLWQNMQGRLSSAPFNNLIRVQKIRGFTVLVGFGPVAVLQYSLTYSPTIFLAIYLQHVVRVLDEYFRFEGGHQERFRGLRAPEVPPLLVYESYDFDPIQPGWFSRSGGSRLTSVDLATHVLSVYLDHSERGRAH